MPIGDLRTASKSANRWIENLKFDGTVRRGSGHLPGVWVHDAGDERTPAVEGAPRGAADARLFCVVTTRPGEQGRFYRLPTEADLEAVRKAADGVGAAEGGAHRTVEPGAGRRTGYPRYPAYLGDDLRA